MKHISIPHRYWVPITFGVIAFSVAVARNYPHTVSYDAAFFQHAGWYMLTSDAMIYTDIWDIKPPLLHFTSLFLAFLAGGHPFIIHTLGTLFNGVMILVILASISAIIHHYTMNDVASITGSVVVLTLGGFYDLAAMGIRPKYPAIAFGLLGIVLALRDRYVVAGLLAAFAAAYIQHAAIFTILTIGLAYQHGKWVGLRNAFGGVTAAVVVVVAPIVALGAGEAMLTEVVLVSFVENSSRSLFDLVRSSGKGLHYMGLAAPAITLGAYGAYRSFARDVSAYWWVTGGAAFATYQIYFLDFDSYPDLFFGLVFAAIGLGLYTHYASVNTQRVVGVLVAVGYVSSVVAMGGFGVITSDNVFTTNPMQAINDDTYLHSSIRWVRVTYGPQPMRLEDPAVLSRRGNPFVVPDMKALFWERQPPPACHYRLSGTEQRYMRAMNRSQDDCGRWPGGGLKAVTRQ